MEIPPPTNKPGHSSGEVSSSIKPHLPSLLKQPGNQFQAQVLKSIPLSHQQMLKAQNVIAEAERLRSLDFSQNAKSSAPNASKLNGPLHFVELSISGNKLSAFTNQDLKINEQIKVQVNDNRQLQLIRALSNEAPLSTSASKSADAIKASLLTSLHSNASLTLSQALKTFLPQQQSLTEILNTLSSIIRLKNTLPTTMQKTLLPNNAWKTLQNLSERSLAGDKLNAQPTQGNALIKDAMRQSGNHLEAQLARIVKQYKASSQNSGANTNANASASSKPTSLHQPMPQQQMTQQASLLESLPAKLQQALSTNIQNDLKAQLIKLSNELAHQSQQANPSPLSSLSSNLANAASTQALLVLFQQLTQSAQRRENITPQQRAEFLHRLSAVLGAGVAKLTVTQIQHLLAAVNDASMTPNAGIFEFPIKYHDTSLPLHLQIQEFIVKEKEEEQQNENANDKKQQKRLWKVFMEFDLDELGRFSCEITALDNSVKTTLWAEDTQTRNNVRKRLEELRQTMQKSGIEVETLSCPEGYTPMKPMKLSTSLVDIKT